MDRKKITGSRVLVYSIGIVMVSLGIVLCKKSNLGISPVSSISFVLEEITGLSFGTLTMLFHLANSLLQLVLAKRLWDMKIYLQVPLAFIFGAVIDALQKWIAPAGTACGAGPQSGFYCGGHGLYDPDEFSPESVGQHCPQVKPAFARGLGRVKMDYDISCVVISVILGFFKVYPDRLREAGIMAYPLEFMSPKLPGLGDVDWGKYVSALTDIGYQGYTCIEVEDKAFEGSLEDVKKSVMLSARYLRNFVI